MAKLPIDHHVPELGQTVGEALLRPTRLYPRLILNILKSYRVKVAISGLAHITGGGLKDNIERLLPEGCRLSLDRVAWPVPALFSWLQGLGGIDRDEMYHVFNMGIGFTLIVRPRFVDSIRQQLSRAGTENWIVGEIKAGPRGVDYLT